MWPKLTGVRAGVVVIDHTSFRTEAALERALTWARDHSAARMLVLADLGDRPSPVVEGSGWARWSWR